MADPAGLLRRLVGQWRATRAKLGLPAAASFADVGRRLNVDRGTAQRLNRIGRLAAVAAADLEQFPGVRAWHRVVAGAAEVLGADDPSVVALGQACEAFALYLAAAGGSRSAAVRHLQVDLAVRSDVAAAGDPLRPDPAGSGLASDGWPQRLPAASAWVQAAADLMGYCVDVRVDVQLVRETAAPADGSARRVQMAVVNAVHGCRGRRGAMPLAFIRHTRSPAFRAADGQPPASPPQPSPFRVLRAGTSTPTPAVLTTGNAHRHTIFVEPQWPAISDSMHLALLQQPEPFDSPWVGSLEWLEFACVNRHPCRRLILDRVVTTEKDAATVPALAAFRSHNDLSHDEPWFDRLPQPAPVRRVGTVADAIALPDADQPFPGYAAVLAEAIDALGWPADELVLHRATVDNPIPLATYTLMFERRRP